MKTFKVVEPRKLVAWILVVMFSLLQIVPTGWAAARPVEELQARGVPSSVEALAKSVKAAEPAPAMQRVPTFVDSTAFQLNENPLSPVTPEPKSEPDLIPYTPPVEVQVQPQIPTTPPIVIDLDKAVPAPTKVVTDPATGKELSVSVNDRGIATVKWGDQEYKGFFDAATNSVHLITNDDSIWTLQFAAKEDGSLYLQSFHSSFWSAQSSSEETYTFNAQAQLLRKDWVKSNSIYEDVMCMCVEGMSCDCPQGGRSTFSYGGTIDYVTINGKALMSHEKSWSESSGLIVRWGGRSDSESWYSYDAQGNLASKSWETKNIFGSSYGQETYVQISGKTLLSSSKVWQYNNLRIRFVLDLAYLNKYEEQLILDEKIRMPFYISSHTETFYAYDAEGNLVSELSATEGYDYNNVRHTRGTLWTRDADKNTWALISAEGIDPFKVWFRQDASEIKALAQRMTVYVGGNEERYNYTHRVEYTRNSDGSMTAKAVYDNAGNVSIVQGEPDILSNETNDITFRNGQQVNGYTVYYQEYGHEMKPGWFNDGYRLVFYDSNWNATAVDFPAQNTVVLNGIENKITIDPDGILALQEVPPVIPPAVQTYVDALQSAVGSRYTVNVFRQESGMYLISVGLGASCQPVCKVVILPKLGEMEGMSFNISADGKPDVSTLVVAYNVLGISREDALRGVTQPAVDAQLLYEVLQQLMDRVHPILVKPLPVIPAEPKDPELLSDRLRATLDPASIFNMIDQVLIAMTHITVTAVTEDGAIHFTKDGVDYKCYRDLTGNVIVERALPSAVQAYVDQLQGALGEGFEVIADAEWGDKGDGRVYNGFYLIRIVNKYPKPGALDVLEFETDSNGVMVKGSVFAVYGGVPQVDSQLLYAALIQLQYVDRPIRITDPVLPLDPSDLVKDDPTVLPNGSLDLELPLVKIDILIQMTQITVASVTEGGTIHFVKDGVDYKCYRDAEGNVVVEQALPPAVQALVDALNQSPYFKVSVNAVEGSVPLQYQFSVVNTFPCTDNYCVKTFPGKGMFSFLGFTAFEDGLVDASTVRALYHDDPFTGESITVDGALLYEGLKALALKNGQPVDMQALALMTRIILTEVTASGKIRFNKDGIAYKIFRDESENVLLTRDIPGLPDNHFVAYLGDVADHFGISVDAIVEIYEFQCGAVCLGPGCPTWAIEVSFKAIVGGSETTFSGMVSGPAWDVPVNLDPVQASPSGAVAQSANMTQQEANEDYVEPLSFATVVAPEAYEWVEKVQPLATAGSLGLVSNLLKAPVVAADSGTAETSAIFGFEQGSLLFSKVLKTLTK